MRAEGAKLFAEALKVNATLTSVEYAAAHPTFLIWHVSAAADTCSCCVRSIQDNGLDEQAKEGLRKAVEGRDHFDLKL